MSSTTDRDSALRDTLTAADAARQKVGYYQAQELQLLAEYPQATDEDDLAYLEIAARYPLSDRAAQQRLGFARELVERLPQTLAALQTGKVAKYQAKLIADTVAPLSNQHTTQVEDQVLDNTAEQTTGNSAPP